MSVTILVTGFGPFPGAPFNPTEALVKRLARLRRPSLSDAKIVPHVFPTRYAAVDHDLPKLIGKHKPDALLMFGLAPRTSVLRIETRARNSLALLADAGGNSPRRAAIVPGKLPALAMPAPARRLFAAVRTAGVPAMLSHDAGRYLRNYLCWRAVETTRKNGGPRLAAFVHVPLVRRGAGPRRANKRRISLDDLTCAGSSLLVALTAAARR
jgi:pyroglutamyl-peptidase